MNLIILKILSTIGIVLGLLMIALTQFNLLDKPSETMGAVILPRTFTDLIGTRIASTTTGVAWYGAYTASSTYPFDLFDADRASVMIYPLTASSTGQSGIDISFLGSNDPNCSTATTSTSFNLMTKTEIRWFDASSYIANASAFSAFSNATSTYGWIDPSKNQREVHFDGLNIKCLAVEITASSTILYAGYKLVD